MDKLLIASDSFLPRWDGIARFLSEIIPELCEHFEVTVLAPQWPRGEPVFRDSEKVKIITLPTIKKQFSDFSPIRVTPKAIRTVRDAVRDADLIFTQTIGPLGIMTLLAGSARKKRMVSYVHSVEWDLVTKGLSLQRLSARIANRIVKTVARFLYNRTSLMMVPSQEVGELLSWNKIRTKKAIVRLGVDITRFKPAENKAAAKEKIGLDPNGPVIGFLPRLSHEKDPLTLLRAFVRIRGKHPDATLLAIGDGDKRIIERFANQRGVWIAGMQPDVVPFLQAMDINVLPSLTETTSLSTLEAMACGCAVIATPAGLVKDYIESGENGYIFPEKDVFRLTKFLEDLLTDDELRAKLGEAARETVEKRFSWDLTVAKIKQLLSLEVIE